MKTIVVLGMHRSCTSLIAKGLHETDCFMGANLLGAGNGNENGHYEDEKFIKLNDLILENAGGSWDNPPPEEDIINVGRKDSDSIRKFVRMFERYPVWGWKDPRTTLTIRCFEPHLKNPVYVPCFRNPVEAALSLCKRDGTSYKKNVALVYEYNKRLLNFLTSRMLH